MAEIELGSVPFQEAIDHFRSKLNIPSERWDDLRGQINAKAFTVAGATKADLLSDLRGAVDQAIAEGINIADFRKQFDQAVRRHGWRYRGQRGWRSRVIYDNNLRTARMAGRWQQIQRVKDRRPYLQYLTVGDERVRPQHRTWDGTVLPVDDIWWTTHYPPNGWGCRCTVRTLSQRQMERMGLEVSETPDVETTERINTSTGEVYGEVPVGIDVGWDYNVGKAWLGPDIALGERVMSLPPAMRRRALRDARSLQPYIADHYRSWANQVLERDRSIGEIRTVGYLSPRVTDELIRRGHPPSTAVITTADRDVLHMVRDVKREKRLPKEVVSSLPQALQDAPAVLWDREDPALLYVIDAADEERKGKLVVRINFATKGRAADGQRHSVQTNMVRTSGLVGLRNLRDRTRYDLLEGEL